MSKSAGTVGRVHDRLCQIGGNNVQGTRPMHGKASKDAWKHTELRKDPTKKRRVPDEAEPTCRDAKNMAGPSCLDAKNMAEPSCWDAPNMAEPTCQDVRDAAEPSHPDSQIGGSNTQSPQRIQMLNRQK
ncbi:hypothetical protein DFH08DRAFT_812683 [Mycena albidolilacea]|uniref:Uncharacterized protein n=1 Tax=Mycena albidolilacea TaxID=1033008 RepID=A0AAD7ENZ8_9AGAR|nr:hypothetical protein DFH08DRAFT_812683 [Mycena albidolilacea]